MAIAAMQNAMLYCTVYNKECSKIRKLHEDSPSYFKNHQYQQSLIPQDYKWATDDTKSLLVDMFQTQQFMENAQAVLNRQHTTLTIYINVNIHFT